MKRFLWGLFAGGASAGVTWLLSRDATWTVVAGVAVALIVWFWSIVEAVAEIVGDIFEAILKAIID